MRKVIAAFNMTLDGVFDHSAGIPDEELHNHYTELLNEADAILYGRTTYQLMEYWRNLLENPSGIKSMDDFAVAIDKLSKIVFSRTINEVEWASATIAKRELEDEVLELKQQSGNNVLIGSRSLIIQLLSLGLIDEFQLCVYPVVAGKGFNLFENFNNRIHFKLIKSKTFNSGAIILYYQPRVK